MDVYENANTFIKYVFLGITFGWNNGKIDPKKKLSPLGSCVVHIIIKSKLFYHLNKNIKWFTIL